MTAFDITIHVDLDNGQISCDPPELQDKDINTVANAMATTAAEAITCVLATVTENAYTPTDGGLTYAVISCGALEQMTRKASASMHNPGENEMIDEAIGNMMNLKTKQALSGIVNEIVSGILDHLFGGEPTSPESVQGTPDVSKFIEHDETTAEQEARARALFLPHPDKGGK